MNNHQTHPELWFRPSPQTSFAVLYNALRERKVLTTPRLGKRDETHPKGYTPGTVAVMRLFDDIQQERLVQRVVINRIVVIKRLHEFTIEDLANVVPPQKNWKTVQKDLSFFEGRHIADDELVSIIECEHLS